jgi:DNA polymerase-3 subunit epsilon
MKGRGQFLAAAGVLALLMLVPLLLLGGLLWLVSDEAARGVLRELFGQRVALFVFALALCVAVAGMLLFSLYRSHVLRVHALAEQIRLITGPNPDLRLADEGPAQVRELARGVNALAAQRDGLRVDIAEHVACAQKTIEAERNRLAALMGELAQSVVVCNLDGRVLLYNARAREQFRNLSSSPQLADGGEMIGLGRSIYAAFDRSVIRHALEAVRRRIARHEVPSVATFITGCGAGHLMRVQMSPVLSDQRDAPERVLTGFILLLGDITDEFAREAHRDRLMQSLIEDNRAALSTLTNAVESLAGEELARHSRERLLRVVRDEAGAMRRRFDTAADEIAEARRCRWPLEEMPAVELVEAARGRIAELIGLEVAVGEVADVWVEVDSYSLLQAVAFLAWRITDACESTSLSLCLRVQRGAAVLELVWVGHPVSEEIVAGWEIEPMSAAGGALTTTVREVVERHRGELRFERTMERQQAALCIELPLVEERVAGSVDGRPAAESRPEFYDFDIFDWSERSREQEDSALSALSYTVFDTETTGLDPSGGDEIIQIGATRIVNGKLLRGESFERLVDPHRPLSPESVAIHGIRAAMLEGQPNIAEVLPTFRAFVADTVLVAHNAAFDMRFLQLKQAATGVEFDVPVLDTLLISALLHPNQDSHQLEAIAERLGVTINGRHTALGDALVTAEVFIRMLPLLSERGIITLGQLREACEQTYYARIRY